MKPLFSRFRIYHFYYLIAGFDVAMILVSLVVNHLNVKSLESSIEINKKFVSSIEMAEKLTQLAALANAPGNDVFDSRDVKKERARLDKAIDDYHQFFAKTLASTIDLPHDDQEKVKESLKRIEASMLEMVFVAKSIFDHFENNEEKKAGSKMATMDQRYAELNNSLADLRKQYRIIQGDSLGSQALSLRNANMMEMSLGIVVVFMVVLVAWFGHLMSQKSDDQEKLFIRNAKMVALGEMAGGIAHEINNPLTVIKGRISQLRRLLLADKLEVEQSVKYLGDLEITINRVNSIVKGLRVFSRASDKEAMSTVSVGKIINDVMGICQERLLSHGVKFEIICIESMPLSCRPIQIEQILVNLVNNSFDAIHETKNPWIKIEATMHKRNIVIKVTDSGSGIPKDVAEKLMQPFFTTKPVGKGTGLGLSISAGIAESHQGSLRLNHNCPNTQFVLTLPNNVLSVGNIEAA